jgi:hypothetical protein
MTHPTVSAAMPVIMDQRDSWFTGAVGAVLVAGAVFLGVVMSSVYERILGVCFEWQGDRKQSTSL